MNNSFSSVRPTFLPSWDTSVRNSGLTFFSRPLWSPTQDLCQGLQWLLPKAWLPDEFPMKQREDGAEGAGPGSSTAVGLKDATQEKLKSKCYLLTERGSSLCGSNAPGGLRRGRSHRIDFRKENSPYGCISQAAPLYVTMCSHRYDLPLDIQLFPRYPLTVGRKQAVVRVQILTVEGETNISY